MIRRVRRQFICITMAMLTTVLLIPLIALNAVSYTHLTLPTILLV
mgnify:CR=1 FL=1